MSNSGGTEAISAGRRERGHAGARDIGARSSRDEAESFDENIVERLDVCLQRHADRVVAVVLGPVTLGSRAEIDHLTEDAVVLHSKELCIGCGYCFYA